MGLFNIGGVGLGTAWNFALGLPKHDLGWPSLRPLFRDNKVINPFVPLFEFLSRASPICTLVCTTDLYMYGLITKSVRQARQGRMCTAHFEGWLRHGYSVQIYIMLRFFLAR